MALVPRQTLSMHGSVALVLSDHGLDFVLLEVTVRANKEAELPHRITPPKCFPVDIADATGSGQDIDREVITVHQSAVGGLWRLPTGRAELPGVRSAHQAPQRFGQLVTIQGVNSAENGSCLKLGLWRP